MKDLEYIVYLLPVVFMFHDFEEIIFFKPWFENNERWLKDKYSFIPQSLFSHFEKLSTAGFALMVAEEFIVISAVTFYSVISGNYYWWMGLFIAFFIHLVMHIAQWLVVCRYIPTIITSFLCLPYCIYGLAKIIQTNVFTIGEMFLYTILAMLISLANLFVIHKIGSRIKV